MGMKLLATVVERAHDIMAGISRDGLQAKDHISNFGKGWQAVQESICNHHVVVVLSEVNLANIADPPADTDAIRKVLLPILDRENRDVEGIDDGPTGSKKSRVLTFSAAGVQD